MGKIGKIIVFCLAICTTFFAFGQKPSVVLAVNVNQVATNESVVFTLSSNVDGSTRIDYPVEFDVDPGIEHGMDQVMESSGKIRSNYYMRQSGVFSKKGKFTIIATIKYKGKTFYSNKINVKVDDKYTNQNQSITINTNDPIFGTIYPSCQKIYEGQAFTCVSRVFGYVKMVSVGNYESFVADRPLQTEQFHSGRHVVTETKVNGKKAATFDYGKQLFFASGVGKVKFKPFQMVIGIDKGMYVNEYRIKSQPLNLTILPLPKGKPIDFIDAVGVFEISQEYPKTKLKQGDVFTLVIVVSGVGNLQNTSPPALNLPVGCKIYGAPEKEEEFNYTEQGASGKITYKYNIQVSTSGKLHFEAPGFSFFDHLKEKYISIKGTAFDIESEGTGKISLGTKVISTGKNHLSQSNSGIKNKQLNDKKSTSLPSWFWFIVLPAMLVMTLFSFYFYFKPKKILNQEELTSNVNSPEIEKVPHSKPSIERVSISELEKSIVDSSDFARLLPQYITENLSDHLKMEEFNREKLVEFLQAKNNQQGNRLKEIISTCDHVRFGFGPENFNPFELWNETKMILKNISV